MLWCLVNSFPLYLFLILRFSDVILATILATKSEMCGQKFELKIDNVRFVGHPTLLQHALGQVRPPWADAGLQKAAPCSRSRQVLAWLHLLLGPEGLAEKDTGVLALVSQPLPLAFAVCIQPFS